MLLGLELTGKITASLWGAKSSGTSWINFSTEKPANVSTSGEAT